MCTAALGKCISYSKFTCSLFLDYVAFWMIWTKLSYYTVAYRQPTVQWASHWHSDWAGYLHKWKLILYLSNHYNKFKTYVEDNLSEPMSKNHTECLNDHHPMSLLTQLLCLNISYCRTAHCIKYIWIHFRHELMLPNSTNNKHKGMHIFAFNSTNNALQDGQYKAVYFWN